MIALLSNAGGPLPDVDSLDLASPEDPVENDELTNEQARELDFHLDRASQRGKMDEAFDDDLTDLRPFEEGEDVLSGSMDAFYNYESINNREVRREGNYRIYMFV